MCRENASEKGTRTCGSQIRLSLSCAHNNAGPLFFYIYKLHYNHIFKNEKYRRLYNFGYIRFINGDSGKYAVFHRILYECQMMFVYECDFSGKVAKKGPATGTYIHCVICVTFIWYYKVDTTHDRDGLTFTHTFTLCRARTDVTSLPIYRRGDQPLAFSGAIIKP